MTGFVLGEDRLPSDPRLHRLAARTLGLAYHLSRIPKGAPPLYPAGLVHAAQARWMQDRARDLYDAVPAIVDLLVREEFIAFDEGHVLFRRGTWDEAIAEGKEERFRAFARGLARRCSADKAVRPRLEVMFLRFRALNAIHDTSDGTLTLARSRDAAILIPAGYAVDEAEGPHMAGGHLLVRSPGGCITGFWAPPSAIATVFPSPDRAVVTVRLDRVENWQAVGGEFGALAVTPLRNRKLHPSKRGSLEPAWEGLRTSGKAASAHVGGEIDYPSWRRFVGALGKSHKIETHAARKLHALVDPEIRKACLRVPTANLSLANWFASPDPEARRRRLQASQAYPLLTPHLHRVTDAIDAGKPLEPALAQALSLPTILIRHLRGQHWQSVGKAYGRVVMGIREQLRLSSVASAVPPERLPSTPSTWNDFLFGVGALHDLLAWPLPDRIARDASADWKRLAALQAAGLNDALYDTSTAIRNACGHLMPPSPSNLPTRIDMSAVRRAVVLKVIGKEGGLGRIERFAAAWHRGVTARQILKAEIERTTWGDAPKEWLPLTATPYEAQGGRLEWITTPQGLLDEGSLMRHCVGSHEWLCLYESSHVASVHGRDGGRSTVEFTWRRLRARGKGKRRPAVLGLSQHKAARNEDPPEDCEAVVRSFLDTGSGAIDAVRVEREASKRGKWRSARDADAMLPEDRLRLLRAYDGCLGKDAVGMGPQDWLAVIEAARVAEPAAPAPKAGDFDIADFDDEPQGMGVIPY